MSYDPFLGIILLPRIFDEKTFFITSSLLQPSTNASRGHHKLSVQAEILQHTVFIRLTALGAY